MVSASSRDSTKVNTLNMKYVNDAVFRLSIVNDNDMISQNRLISLRLNTLYAKPLTELILSKVRLVTVIISIRTKNQGYKYTNYRYPLRLLKLK